jgi:hypothetical protein
MGELHMAANTLRGTLFVAQHPAPDELFAAYDRDIPEPCVVPITPRNWPEVSARTRAVLVNDHDIRVAFTYDAGTARPAALPIGALVVAEVDGRPMVRTRDGRQQFDLNEFFIEILTIEAVDSFKIFGSQDHTPRLTIDRLVVCREAWHLEPAALPFARIKDEAARFVAARRWARELGLPRWVFVKAPVERKPFFVDFESPVLVGLLAKAARRTQEHGAAGARITLSEMLPTIDQAWLHDAQGQHYTSELRIVAVDSAAPHNGL